ncbi:DUF5988 family protein [Nocardia arthritidis]|uniref:DUF5988 family protein n=1 Tax=Nocardia arthritidis TaxID=228602 RepID=UPI003D1617CD
MSRARCNSIRNFHRLPSRKSRIMGQYCESAEYGAMSQKGWETMQPTKVMLVGGPAKFPDRERIREVEDPTDKIKVQFGGGYEHFVNSGEFAAHEIGSLPVFKWCGRTKFAE